MIRPPTHADVIARNLKPVGWSSAVYIGVRSGPPVELSHDDRLILPSAPTLPQAWQLAKRAGVGDDGYED